MFWAMLQWTSNHNENLCEVIIPAFEVRMHTYILLWNQGSIFNLSYGGLKKKKLSMWNPATIKGKPSATSEWFSLVLASRGTCANMLGLPVDTAIPLHCISDNFALKGQNNFLSSPVPGLCYDRTLKLYVGFFFWKWFWNNWGAMAQQQGFCRTVQEFSAGVNSLWSIHTASFYFT